NRSARKQHNIGWLQVAVDDATLMRVPECRANLLTDFNHLFPGQPADACKQSIEGFAFQILHGVERRSLEVASRVVSKDVWVAELLENGNLALKASERGLVAARTSHHDLDSDPLAGLAIDGAIDGPHGAAAELLFNIEGTDSLPHLHGQFSVLRKI